ncbi:MAG TPA: hypothetical protein PLA94_15295, partial [Myxococcota bacterium]|nr:hypothetical protein [Myxococcota bacterium]
MSISRRALLQGGALVSLATLLGCRGEVGKPETEVDTTPTAPTAGSDRPVWTLLVGPADGDQAPRAALVLDALDPEGKLPIQLGVRATSGVDYTLRAVAGGAAMLGIAQSPVLAGTPQDPRVALASLGGRLRVVGQLAPTACTLLAPPGSGIEKIGDLAGRRVGVVSGDRSHQIALGHLGAALGIPVEDAATAASGSIQVVAMELAEVEEALNAKKLDAIFCSVQHPADMVYRVLARTAARP